MSNSTVVDGGGTRVSVCCGVAVFAAALLAVTLVGCGERDAGASPFETLSLQVLSVPDASRSEDGPTQCAENWQPELESELPPLEPDLWKPGPWGESDCVVAYDGRPFTVLCRDAECGLAYAADHGEAFPDRPTAPGGFVDPVEVHAGLDIYTHVRERFAPLSKFAPVVFESTPPFSNQQWAYFQKHPDAWEDARSYWSDVREQSGRFRRLHKRAHHNRKRFRQIVLRDGYLFTEDHHLARYVFKDVSLPDLFRERTIFLQRGDEIMRLKRRRDRYVRADGPLRNHTVGIFPLDRVALTRAALDNPRHWELDTVRFGLGLHTLSLEEGADITPFRSTFLSGEELGGFLFRHGGQTAVVVAGIPPARWKELHDGNRERMDARMKILAAAEKFTQERIRFDEPEVEIGQQDGLLREAWYRAYRNRKLQYEVNGVTYDVFGFRGTPKPPQVCIDFLMDSVERAFGHWWRREGRMPGRDKGRVRWSNYEGLRRRSVRGVIQFAAETPEIFEAYGVPKEEEVPYRDTERFYRNLEEFPVDFQEADMIMIWGYKNDGKRHYHSFFVHRIDPIDGFPIVLSDNAGVAAVRVWHDIMRRAPRRYIHHRIRIRDDWLLTRAGRSLTSSE